MTEKGRKADPRKMHPKRQGVAKAGHARPVRFGP